ncbi:hypothetical protein FACS1894159_04260 [Bacteroidia bacterium]|nr:hypothetical protein FACS1894159_04260 [Bacteroidia bacterium]
MKKILFLFIFSACCLSGADAKVASPVGIFDLEYTFDYDYSNPAQLMRVWDDCHAVATLQGIVNRDTPRLYIHYIKIGKPEKSVDRYWWDQYSREGAWLDGCKTVTYKTIEELITAYCDHIDGVVLYDSDVASTSNIASSIAGIENLIALRYDTDPGSLYTRLVVKGPKLPVKVRLINKDGSPMFTGKGMIPGTNRKSTTSIKCDPYIWFIENYMKKGKCCTDFAGYYIDQKWRENKGANKSQHTLTNHDFFVSRKSFFYDLSPFEDTAASDDPTQPPGTDYAVYKELLQLAYNQNGGKKFLHVGGYPPWFAKYPGKAEPATIRIFGAYNAILDADAPGIAAVANCSFWQHFKTDESYPQQWISREELKKRGLLTEDGKVDFKNRDFIIFYVGCYDNPAWTSRNTLTLWDDPNRGKLPLMWCVTPIIEQRAPHVLHYWRHSASPNDYFAAGDNGAGYTSVGQLQEPRFSGLPDGCQAWEDHNKPYYEKWGLSVTGFIINTFAPPMGDRLLDAFQGFSYNGIVPNGDEMTLARLYKGMPMLKSVASLTNTKMTLDEAAQVVVRSVKNRQPFHFHWYRAINMSPTWYVELMERVHKLNPDIMLLDAPAYFELLRIWLEQNPNAFSSPGQ